MLRRLYGLSRNNSRIKRFKTTHAMSSTADSKVGVPLNEVVDAIRKFADPSLATSWDNVGLLVEPTQPKVVSCVLLTNDLTEDVMEEAVRLNTDLIITYHPLIFDPLKSITMEYWKVLYILRHFLHVSPWSYQVTVSSHRCYIELKRFPFFAKSQRRSFYSLQDLFTLYEVSISVIKKIRNRVIIVSTERSIAKAITCNSVASNAVTS